MGANSPPSPLPANNHQFLYILHHTQMQLPFYRVDMRFPRLY